MAAKKPAAVSKKARIFLVDDHPIVRRGLQFLLGMEPTMTVCGEAESGREALEKIQALQPDAVVVDLTLKESSGLDLLKDLRNRFPKVKVLVFSMHNELFYAERVLRGGAHGYITKEEGTEKAVEALRAILQGRKFVSESVTSRLLDTLTGPISGTQGPSVDRLSDRELEVLQMLGSGLGTRAIAEKLKLSVKTIESYREHIKTKLALSGAVELTSYAFKWVQQRERP
jgi:DNA-binding NarL/FixJ family response regulator